VNRVGGQGTAGRENVARTNDLVQGPTKKMPNENDSIKLSRPREKASRWRPQRPPVVAAGQEALPRNSRVSKMSAPATIRESDMASRHEGNK